MYLTDLTDAQKEYIKGTILMIIGVANMTFFSYLTQSSSLMSVEFNGEISHTNTPNADSVLLFQALGSNGCLF